MLKFDELVTEPVMENVLEAELVILYHPAIPRPPTSKGPTTVPAPDMVGINPGSRFLICISSTLLVYVY